MTESEQLSRAIKAKLLNSNVRCRVVSGMWIIELIVPGLNFTNKQAQIDVAIQAFQTVQLQHKNIWKLFIYGDRSESYTMDGTLHTVEQEYDHEGISTTTLSGNDCYVDLTAFDGETLQLGPHAGTILLARESLAGGSPVLGYQEGAKYIWLEALGGNYGISTNGTKKLLDGSIEIVLGADQ